MENITNANKLCKQSGLLTLHALHNTYTSVYINKLCIIKSYPSRTKEGSSHAATDELSPRKMITVLCS